MRPYVLDRLNHGAFRVGATMIRSNRNAAGLTATLERSSGKPTLAKLPLFVRGGFDSLGVGLIFRTTRVPCTCCGVRGPHSKVRLNESGRLKLRALRRKRKVAT